MPAARVVHEQPFKYVDFYVRPIARHLAQHLHALRNGEEWLFFGITQNRNDELAKNVPAALDQVQMAVRDRIERAGIDGNRRFHRAACRTCILTQAGRPPR